MATQDASHTNVGKKLEVKEGVVIWENLGNGDEGSWEVLPNLADKTVHVFGAFGVGGTVVLKGTNEPGTPANEIQLVDPQGNDLSFTAAAIEVMLENPLKIRPEVTAGDGDTDLTVIICAK